MQDHNIGMVFGSRSPKKASVTAGGIIQTVFNVMLTFNICKSIFPIDTLSVNIKKPQQSEDKVLVS